MKAIALTACIGSALIALVPAAHSIREAPAADPCRLRVGATGSVSVRFGRRSFATMEPGLFEAVWRGASLVGTGARDAAGVLMGSIRTPSGATVDCETRVTSEQAGARFAYRLTPKAAVRLNSLHIAFSVPAVMLAGGSFTADGEAGAFPTQMREAHLRSKPTKRLELRAPSGAAVTIECDEATPVLIQDDRQWGPSFTVRIGPQMDGETDWPAGKPLDLAFRLTSPGGVQVEQDGPVTLVAGPDWIPLDVDTEIEAGSALDFSAIVPWHSPAGSLGRVKASGAQFVFEKKADTPVRFYGVNLCFSAQYLTHEQSDKLAERLKRMGYNAVRFHHYEGELVDRSGGNSVTLDPQKLDQLDYLFAALKKRGIYMTTDLFVSRPVFAAEVWPGESGNVGMDEFKMAVPVNERAFANFRAFSTALLTHMNPYTQTRWGEDPALAWLSLINEGNPGNFIGGLTERCKADWMRSWTAWLERRYPSAAARAEALGGQSDPGSALPPTDAKARVAFEVFLADNQMELLKRSAAFLREIKCPALLTNMNAWTNPLQTQAVRAGYDYVDDHFYVDHPEFVEQPWRLPSRCANTSPVADGAPGGRGCAFIRLLDRPFTVSEYNYSGPGRFRGVGGILTGALGAIQDWSVIWRFAWGHNRDALFAPAPLGYFDIVTDPLNLAAERASVCMFRRGDLGSARHSIAIEATPEDVLKSPESARGAIPSWSGLAWVTRVGYMPKAAATSADRIALPLGWADPSRVQGRVSGPFDADAGAKLVAEMRKRGWLAASNPTSFDGPRFQSETGQLTIDAPADVLTINTPMTSGGYAPEGATIKTDQVTVKIEKTDATVWVSSLEASPIGSSKRLLITHLTDLQNTDIRYGDLDRRMLLAWGGLPHLMLNGSATVTIRMKDAGRARVWALSTGGKRVAQVTATAQGGALVVPLSVEAGGKARMIYEVEAP
ncbi:MAG: hypothetical protein FJX72_04100 [Armatimonadetes bacterium]|nr:hypothetical protein [Armatimonadota bacterium]